MQKFNSDTLSYKIKFKGRNNILERNNSSKFSTDTEVNSYITGGFVKDF